MAILTNSGGVQLTNNAGKPLVYDTGSILKIEYNCVNTQTISNTIGYVDSAVFVNIYPTNASSKILIEANFFAFQLPTDSTDPTTPTTKVAPVSFRFTRTIGGTTTYLENVGELGGDFGFAGEEENEGTFNSIGMLTKLLYVDSPNTTTTIVYRVQFRNFAETEGVSSASIGHDRKYFGITGAGGGAYNNPSSCKSIIIATEFSA